MSESAVGKTPWYRRIGPGLITACVVIGPGSIMTSSKVGANSGYSMLWIVAVSVLFMLHFMTLGARLGVVAAEAPGDLIRQKAGKWLAILVGCGVFFISAAYQSGNNIGVGAAFESFIESKQVVAGLIVLFNAIAIGFLFLFKNLYRTLERLMMGFVGLMLLSFAANLVTLKAATGRPAPVEFLSGLIPKAGQIDIAVLGLIGTTFVVTAAFYQAYLVRQKGWTEHDLRDGMIDTRVGSIIMALITVMLVSTTAAGLYQPGQTEEIQLSDPVAVATALEPTFGTAGRIIFCFGLFSAAYSSFLVNSMIGGFMAADGLGIGSKPTDLWPRILTTLALLSGMSVALFMLILDFDRTPTIIAAQAVTVVASPLVAGTLIWLTSRKDIMGKYAAGPASIAFSLLGLGILICMAGDIAINKLPDTVRKYREKQAAAAVEAAAPEIDEASRGSE